MTPTLANDRQCRLAAEDNNDVALASGGAAGGRNTVETFCGFSGGSVNGMDKVEDVKCSTSRSVEEDVDVINEGTAVPAREVVPWCAAFP